MITLTKSGNAIVFTFDDNDHYLNDGIIEVPVNSLTLVTDESQMATFRKSASNDIFISARYDELGMSKADLESWFKENACGSTGGGGVTPEDVQDMIDESISGKADTSDVQEIASDVATVSGDVNTLSGSVNALTGAVNTLSGDVSTLSGSVDSNHNAITAVVGDVQTLSGDVANKADTTAVTASINAAVSGKMDTSAFNTYSASTDARLSEDEEVTAAGLNALNNALDDKADTTAVTESINAAVSGKADTSAVTASITAAVSGKQDTLIAGTNITISGNVISAAGGNNVIELTQAQYDALTDIDPDAFYIITDADGGVTTGQVQTMIDDSISGKADTSAVTASITAAVSGKMDTSSFNTYSANTDARLAEDEEVTAAGLNALNDALSGKQDTLSAGTNITISGNVISAEGGGKAIEAGRGIAITTGATADTVSFNLPISAGTGTNSIINAGGSSTIASGEYSHAEGCETKASRNYSHAEGEITEANGYGSHAEGSCTKANGYASHAEGKSTTAQTNYSHSEGNSTKANGYGSHAEGYTTQTIGSYSHSEGYQTSAFTTYSHTEGSFTKTSNENEHASGEYNATTSGASTSAQTLFSVGNGTAENARHNAFEIRKNGDIYLTLDGQDVKLQDQLGGGVPESVFTAHTADTVIHVTSTEKATWNAKSDFSGDYNDLTNKPTIPTVPTSNTAFTNDAGYITSVEAQTQIDNSISGKADTSAFTAHTADTTIHTTSAEKTVWNGAATNASNAITALGGLKLVQLTQAQYDALATKDASTVYFITGSN